MKGVAMIKNQEKIIKIIEMFFPEAKIYLFGSWARGDQVPTSDVDVAIDLGKPMPITERAQITTMIDALNIPQEVDIFYAQSSIFTAYLESLKEASVIMDFIRDATKVGYPQAAKKHYGFSSLKQMDDGWRAFCAPR